MARFKKTTLLYGIFIGTTLFLNIIPLISGLQTFSSISTSGTINYSNMGGSWLHTSGTKIYDGSGNEVKLWGVVIQSGDQYVYSQNNLQEMKNMSFNAIRVWIKWGQVEPTGPTVTGTSFFTSKPWQIDNMVQWAANVGLYIILCVDVTSTWPKPSWVPNGNTQCPDGGGSWSLTDNSTLTGIANLYAFMANRYASYSNVIFEGNNEMMGTSSDMANFRAWNNNWISAVEANEGSNSHLKIVQFLVNYMGGTTTAYLNAYPPYVSGTHSNVLLATHSYFLVKSSIGSPSTIAPQIYSACQAVSTPWIDTEFSTATGGTYTGMNTACAAMTQNNISGWGYYCYDGPTGNNYNSAWCINNPKYKTTLLNILQPYMTQP